MTRDARHFLPRAGASFLVIAALALAAPASCHHPADTSRAGEDHSAIDHDDVEFARATFARLTAADPAVQDLIDWDAFRGSRTDVGARYRALGSDAERTDFRAAFVTNFAATFHEHGISPDVLQHWRVERRDGETSTLAADLPKGVLHISLSHGGGGPKIVAISSDLS
jgi:hypothetical protein